MRGAAAGAVGTLALSVWEPVRDRLLGHPPPYSVRDLTTRGAWETWGVRLTPHVAQRLGLMTRWLYGPGMGAVYAVLRPAIPRRARAGGLLLGLAVGVFEQLVFPRLRVTVPPAQWAPAEHALLAVQVLLYGLVTEAVLSQRPEA